MNPKGCLLIDQRFEQSLRVVHKEPVQFRPKFGAKVVSLKKLLSQVVAPLSVLKVLDTSDKVTAPASGSGQSIG